VLAPLKGRHRRRASVDCQPDPGWIRPRVAACCTPHFGDGHLCCQLPSGHDGLHAAELARGRIVRWSVLDPS